MKWIFSLFVFVTLTCLAGPRSGDNYALVVIDMQPHFVERGGNSKDPENIKKVDEILAQQAKLIEIAKKQNIPIVFIEYEGYGDTTFKLKDSVKGYENTQFFTKSDDGMLEDGNNKKQQLADYLNSKQIGNLIITGANGGACVLQSIRGSLRHNYNVLAFTKGIADFNYRDFIYPYSYKNPQSSYFSNPQCESCTFREIEDVDTLTLELLSKNAKTIDTAIDESERGFIKDVTPIRTKSQAKPEASAQ